MEKNKIYLGDAYELIKQLPDKSIDLIVTDPPYDFIQEGGGAFGKTPMRTEVKKLYIREENKGSHVNRVVAKKQNHIASLYTGYNTSIFEEMMRVLKKVNIYIWCNRVQLLQYLKYFDERKCIWDIITWHKDNAMPACGNTFMPDTEYCVYARENGVYFEGNYKTKAHYYVSHMNIQDKALYNHPTIKPLNIIKNLIINSSKEGDLVLDPFLGSGTTAVACKELGRDFIGYEINEEYYNIAVDRLNGITQKERKTGEDIKLF